MWGPLRDHNLCYLKGKVFHCVGDYSLEAYVGIEGEGRWGGQAWGLLLAKGGFIMSELGAEDTGMAEPGLL